MNRAILSLNAGSSSIKFALFALDDGDPQRIAGGKIEGIGTAPALRAQDSDGSGLVELRWPDGAALTHEALLEALLAWVGSHLGEHKLAGIGHRIVHGGAAFSAPLLIDPDVLAALDALCPLAPLHQPHNLSAVAAIRAVAPDVPQVACFDTGFHHGQPEVATRLALPRRFHDQGVRRYGFHGLSYEHIAARLAALEPGRAGGRAIVAHLGNGASLCAMMNGRSIDSSMGFSALDGLMMGTRCGTIDPGVLLYLQQQDGMDIAAVQNLLYTQSGLLGVSGLSSDMRTLHASGSAHAEEAIALFVWRAAREAGGLIASIGGLDTLVFTAGIGENDPDIRARLCARLQWAGIAIDEAANAAGAGVISTSASAVTVRVIPTDEEAVIARHVAATLGLGR